MYQWRSHTHTHSPSRSDDRVVRFSALRLLCHQPVNRACLLTWNIGDKKMRGRAMRKECHTYSTHTQNTPHHISAGPQPTTSKHPLWEAETKPDGSRRMYAHSHMHTLACCVGQVKLFKPVFPVKTGTPCRWSYCDLREQQGWKVMAETAAQHSGFFYKQNWTERQNLLYSPSWTFLL